MAKAAHNIAWLHFDTLPIMTKIPSSISNLAIFGGTPAFPTPLHVNRPNSGSQDDYFKRLENMFQNRWFTNFGPLVTELENRLADFLGVKHCVATCNGTAALQLASKALQLRGQIIVPSFTFIATPHSMLWQGLEPIFCDIDPDTWNIDPEACEKLITNKTSAILAVNIWGRPCNISALQKLANTHGLKLLFDSAHAFGSSYQGSLLGGFGDAEAWSFHATKVFHTFEGGAVTTSSDRVAERVRQLANFGFTGYDHVENLGINAKMPEACAAMGLTNLDAIADTFAASHTNYQRYARELAGIPGLSLLKYDNHERHNYHYVVLEVEPKQLGLSRDQLVSILHKEGIIARRYFFPGCHRMEPYKSDNLETHERLPVTNRIVQRVLVLPSGAAMETCQISRICRILRQIVDYSSSIRPLLQA